MKHSLLVFSTLFTAIVARAQAPVVTTLSPARNAVAAGRSAPVSITLSQPVGAGAGTVRVFSAQRGGRLAGAATATGSTLTFTPPQDFQPGEVVSVTVPATVQSSAGTPLAAAQVYQFTAAATGGTGSFGGGSNIPAGSWPENIAAADVDNDGDLDLLAANASGTGMVSVRLNNGSGSFSNGPGVAVGDFSAMLVVADLDGDGDLDLVTGNSNFLSIRFNNGAGVFGGGREQAVSRLTGRLVAGDVDGDGDIDLLTANSSDGNVSVLLNNGAGTFAAGTAVAAGLPFNGNTMLALGDMDGDGDLDLMTSSPGVVNGNYSLDLRPNNGNGTFGAATSTVAGPVPPSELALADVDGDADLDLLVAGSADVSIRLNNGQGVFTTSGTALISTSVNDINTGDLDGDGDLDLFTTSYSAGTVNIRFNNGAGVFSGTTSLASTPSLYDVTAADLDGDGDLDLLTGGSLSTNVQLFLNQNSSPALAVTSLMPTRNQRNAPRAGNVVVGFSQALDNTAATQGALKVFSGQRGLLAGGARTVAGNTLTLDPAADFRPGERVTATVTTAARSANFPLGRPQVFEFTAAVGGGAGVFGASAPAGGPQFANFVTTADIDNDGDIDALSMSTIGAGAAEVNISRNNGNGTFSNNYYPSIGGDANGLAVVDMDGDGDLDLLTSNGSGMTGSPGIVSVRLNNGSGTFTAGSSIGVGSLTLGIAAGDVDGDGDQDFAVINGYGTVGIGLNVGNGMLGPVTNISTGTPYAVALHDVDNDGDLDLVAALTSQVGICLNNGYGTFGPVTYWAMPSSSRALVVADVNNDGSLDLLTAIGSRLDVRLNDGSGGFAATSTTAMAAGGGGTTLAGLAVGDIDGDGDLDLVASGGSGLGIVSVRLNNGSGVFSGGYDPVVSTPSQTNPNSTALADMDGDGDLDLVVAHFNIGGLRILLNQPSPVITAFAPASAAAGTVVTLTGANLMGATGITINGVAVTSFTVVSGTSITFTVPGGASTGAVVVTTPLGTATSASFTVIAPLTPSISGFSPTAGIVGSSVTITGFNFTGATAVALNGVPVTTFSVASSLFITFVVPAGATTGRVSVTTPLGSATSSQTFTVYPLPVIAAFAPTHGTVGTLVTISGTALNGTSALTLNGVAVPGFTVVNSTTITFVVPPGATSGLLGATATYGPGTSATSFTVDNFAPTLTALDPATVPAGSPAQLLLLTGSGFTPQSQVTFNGTNLSSIYVSATQLLGSMPVSALAVPGTFRVSATTPAPGGGTTAFLNFIVTGITAVNAASGTSLEVYPNPVHDLLFLRLSSPPAAQATVPAALLNSLGQVVAQATLHPAGPAAEAQLPVGHLAPGFYVLQLRTGAGVVTRRVLVE